jgi:hypothetical protein
MKRNNLLRAQQHINYVGFIMLIVSSSLCLSFGCGDAFFPSQLPSLSISSVNKVITFKSNEYPQLIKMDYHRKKDSLCLQLNDQCISLTEGNLGLFLHYGSFSSYNRRDVIDLRVQKELPYKYIEQLFNKLRPLDRRLILLRTNTIGETGGSTGVKLLLPPVNEVYYAAVEPLSIDYLLPPLVSTDHVYWSQLFDKTARPFHVKVNQVGALFYKDKNCLGQEVLSTKLRNDILHAQAQKKDICIWFEISPEATAQQFIETYVTIKNIYEDLWNQRSLKLYGKKIANLKSKEHKSAIRRALPFHLLWLSNKEYQFLKNLEKKGNLETFISEHYTS